MKVSRRALLSGLGAMACGAVTPHLWAAPRERLICSFAGRQLAVSASNFRDAAPEALRAVALITEGVGLRANFDLKAADFRDRSTAFAAIRGGRRRIVYDAAKFSFRDGRTSWRDLGVMAHEIGHHLASHVYLDEVSDHEEELEADHFAGGALARLGASREQALLWTSLVSKEGSATHPPRAKRVEAARAGWEQAKEAMAGRPGRCEREWLGRELWIEGRACRVARTCEGGQMQFRLACRGDDGEWGWVR